MDLLLTKDNNRDEFIGSQLPEDYGLVLCRLSYLIQQNIEAEIGNWEVGTASSPQLRKHYVRTQLDPNDPEQYEVSARNNAENDHDDLLWVAGRISRNDRVFLYGLEEFLDQLERLMRNESQHRERLSPWLSRILSNLSLLVELKRQLVLLPPAPSVREASPSTESEPELVSEDSSIDTRMKLYDVGAPLTKFNYPLDKPRTAAVTKELQEAENNIDLFWKSYDEQWIRRMEDRMLCLE